MLVSTIASALETWAPPPFAESYDNVGLLVGDPNMEVSGVLINLDMTEEVVEEAMSLGYNMIVAHHPIWFMPRKRLNGEDYVSRTIIKAIKHDIALYACHTNLDNVLSGVNQRICQKLGLTNLEFLKPTPRHSDVQIGSGMIGSLEIPIPKKAFLEFVKQTFHCGGIRYADSLHEEIQTVAVCGGAGSFLIQEARKSKADAFVTADITYHKFFDSEGELLLLDIGHYESEQFTSELIHEFISKKFLNFAVRLSEVKTNPIKYF
ncbi:MAG: Nif3-like dinuclear metal center hexameric protein [Bacteroidota bacterium]